MRLGITSLLLLGALHLNAQNRVEDSITVKPKKASVNYFGFRFGGLSSDFSGNGGVGIPAPGGKSLLGWHAGGAMDLYTRKYYNARVELSYISKGGKDTFGNERIEMESMNRSQYVQLSVLPLIVKPGFKKINPYLGLGGYYARRVAMKSRTRTSLEPAWENDPVTARNLNVKNDFGYSLSLGIYVWKRPLLEMRYEAGIPSVSSTSRIKNRSLVLSFSI
ncbi:hypothetical protein DYBT9275_00658 [Dyadobacter sp. CECT 9275]|uniref:Outer membrane protein beta-barrel domain-containing protein n=1 Tax=Dyadobacter helix TaxID=2822344 RepID=A0A916J8W1_9BACT|nr:outer membrane beta-barrel protein [Dyadobacter sp. CECT 9275]CAG4991010.1 hypothetical protein DYBT9275_00658 [Dyadobacter sp. CECT 9275]